MWFATVGHSFQNTTIPVQNTTTSSSKHNHLPRLCLAFKSGSFYKEWLSSSLLLELIRIQDAAERMMKEMGLENEEYVVGGKKRRAVLKPKMCAYCVQLQRDTHFKAHAGSKFLHKIEVFFKLEVKRQALIQSLRFKQGKCSRCGRRGTGVTREINTCAYCLAVDAERYLREEYFIEDYGQDADLQEEYLREEYGQNAKVLKFVEGSCSVCGRKRLVDPRGNICSHCAVDHIGEPLEGCDESSCPHFINKSLNLQSEYLFFCRFFIYTRIHQTVWQGVP